MEKYEIELIEEKTDYNVTEHKPSRERKKKPIMKIAAYTLTLVLIGGAFGGGYVMAERAADDRIALTNAKISELSDMVAELGRAQADMSYQEPLAMQTSTLSQSLSDSVSAVFNKISNSVVSISVTGTAITMWGQTMNSESSGSGVIYSQDDEKVYIVTNYHVISGAKLVNVSLDDKTYVPANYVGGDEKNDLAIISVLKQNLSANGVTGYTMAAFADSSKIAVGDAAIAIGNSAGKGKSATLGIISALERNIELDGVSYSLLQTDAAINPGNSGGPLVNSKGEVVGINTIKMSSNEIEGMGFAIPSNTVTALVKEIQSAGRIDTPYIGVEMVTVTEEIKNQYRLASTGVYINRVESASPAAEAGLRVGDIIIKLGDREIATDEELSAQVANARVGDKLTFTVVRNNASVILEVTVGNRGLSF